MTIVNKAQDNKDTLSGKSKRTNRRVPPPISRLKTRRKLIAFGWYGGKFSHLDWLLPLLPKCHHYCEPFAGSAAILLNRAPSPVETYNDLDGEVCNFFRVLRAPCVFMFRIHMQQNSCGILPA